MFIAYGIANLLLIPSLALDIDPLSALAAVSWLVLLPVATALLGFWFMACRPDVSRAAESISVESQWSRTQASLHGRGPVEVVIYSVADERNSTSFRSEDGVL